MGLKDIDLGAALHRLADRKIEQAMREGKFDRIEGAGQPLDLEPVPVEENARLRWWALRILRQNDVVPDEVKWRKRLDGLREEMDRADNAWRLTKFVDEYNRLVKQVNTLGTNAINLPVAPVVLQDELAKLRGRWSTRRIAAEVLPGGNEVPYATAVERGTDPPPIRPPEPALGVPPQAPGSMFGGALRTCVRATCRSRNPAKAKYCRCCGQSF